MEKSASVIELCVEISRREVLRTLGYPRSRQPSAQVEQALAPIWDPALQELAPRGIYRFIDRAQAMTTQMPRPTARVGIGLCTIGPALEKESERLAQQGQLLESLLWDALGSAAAEATAEALNVALCQEAQRQGYWLHPRISPGYGTWAVGAQEALLPLLEPEKIGVQLTSGMMMIPRKSVSFAVRLSAGEAPEKKHPRRCSGCNQENCMFRDRQ